MSQFKDIMKLSEDGGWLSEDSIYRFKKYHAAHGINYENPIEYFKIMPITVEHVCNWTEANKIAQNCKIFNREWRLPTIYEMYALQLCDEFETAFSKVINEYFDWVNAPNKIEFWSISKGYPDIYKKSSKFSIHWKSGFVDKRAVWVLDWLCDNICHPEIEKHNVIIVS